MKTTLAVLDRSGGDAAEKVSDVLEKMFPEGSGFFNLATPGRINEAKSIEALRAKRITCPVAVGSFSTLPDSPFFQKTSGVCSVLDGKVYFPKADFLLNELLSGKSRQSDLEKSARAFLAQAEGDYLLFVVQERGIIACRDPVGVEPLYFGENETTAALATNRKTLWELGIEETRSFPPGHVAIVTRRGFKLKPAVTLEYKEPNPIDLQESSEILLKLLKQSIRLRVADLEEVAVAFSGGLDSSIVACLAKEAGVEVQLFHVSLSDQPETEGAKKAAEALELPLHVHLFKETDVEKTVPKVIELIEENDPVKAAVGIPFFWVAQKTAAAGFRVMLAGQGADELFGGYKRYVDEYLEKGDTYVRQTMFRDVANIHVSNIERDEKVCSFHDVELRLPFASFGISEFAVNLPTGVKFECKADTLRKLVLRKAAQKMGVPIEIAEKPKKAVQYSTGINNALKRIAKKHNLTQAKYVDQLFQKVQK